MSNEAKTPCYSVSITRSDSIRRSYHTRRPSVPYDIDPTDRTNSTYGSTRNSVLDEVKFDIIRHVRLHQDHPAQTRTDTIKIIHRTINRIEQSTSSRNRRHSRYSRSSVLSDIRHSCSNGTRKDCRTRKTKRLHSIQ